MSENKLYKGKIFKKSLSPEEQIEYLKLIAQGDKNAEEIFFEHNLALVSFVLNRYYRSINEDLKEEYFSVGCLGLAKSIRNFNISFGCDFSTYAVPMILGEIKRYRRENSSMHVPRDIRDLSVKIMQIQKEYQDKHDDQSLSPTELSKILGIDEEDINLSIKANQPVQSVDSTAYTNDKDGKELTIADITPDLDATIYENIEKKETYSELRDAINELTEREKLVITLMFGIGCEKMTQQQVGEICNISQPQVSRTMYEAIKKLKHILPEYIKEEYEPKPINSINQKKKKKNIKKSIYDIFEGYTKEEIDKSLESLNEDEKKILLLKYPYVVDKNDKTGFRNKIHKLGMGYTPAYTQVKKSEEKVRENLIQHKYGIKYSVDNPQFDYINISKKNYSVNIYSSYLNNTKEEVLTAIDSLNDINKKIIELRYGLNGNSVTSIEEIAKTFNFTKPQVSQHISNAKNSIRKNLSKGKNSSMKNTVTEKENNAILEYFRGYTEEQILNAINSLKEINKQIIELKYGLNGNKIHSTKEIAEIVNINYSTLTVRIVNVRQSISRILENTISDKTIKKQTNNTSKNSISRKELDKTIFEYFTDYTEEQILNAINLLNETNKKIIELRFGLNGNKITSIGDIAKTFNFTNPQVSQHIMFSKRAITKYLTNPKEKSNKTKKVEKQVKTIFEYFTDYTEEQILNAINLLNETNKKIIELKYGLNGNKVHNTKEIAEIVNINYSTLTVRIVNIRQSISRILENTISDKTIKKQTNNTAKKSISRKELDKTIFEYFTDYTEEQILNAINLLNETNKKIIELRFGLNGNKITSIGDIAKTFNFTNPQVSQHIMFSKRAITKYLTNPKEKSNKTKKVEKQVKTIFEYFPGYTEEQVMRAINSLDSSSIDILELKFGLNNHKSISNEEIAKLLNIKYPTLMSKINYIKKKVIPKLLQEQKFYHVVHENTQTKAETKEENSTFSLDDKITEIKNSILSNQYKASNSSYVKNGIKITTNVYETNCLLAYKDKRRNDLDRPHSIRKSCYVYVITATDSNNKKISETLLVKDAKNNKFYKFINHYTNGQYDIVGINNNELVCFDLGKIYVEPLELKKETNIDDSNKHDKPFDKETVTTEDIAFTSGVRLFKERKFVLAEKEFMKALNSDKRFILQKTNYYLGRILMAKKKTIIAEKYLQDSLKIDNNDYDSLLEMGKVLSAQQKYDDADKYYDRCSQIKPYDIVHILERGKNYKNQEEFDKAEKLFDLAISKKPTNYFAYLEKGKMLFELDELNEAKLVLNVCNSLTTNKTQHKVLLGKINYLQGNIIDAKKLFKECVESDLQNNVIIGILDIGHFFHEMGEKDLAYEYYSKAPVFRKWINISDYEVKKHIESHAKNTFNENMHSVFNFPVSLELLDNLIQDMEKTTTAEMYDVYQIYCKNAGFMIIDENTTEPEDYITIRTLPFTKRIMQSYPDKQLPNTEIKKSINIEDLLDKQKNVGIVKSEESIPETTDIIIKETNVKTIEEVEGTIITDKVTSPFNKDFEEYKDKFKMLINMLNDPTEQTILLLRLGLVRNKNYTEKEIGHFLNIDEQEVHNIINSALNNIRIIATLTNQSIESAKQQLEMTK